MWLNLCRHEKIFQVGHKGLDLLPMKIGTCLMCFDLLNGICGCEPVACGACGSWGLTELVKKV